MPLEELCDTILFSKLNVPNPSKQIPPPPDELELFVTKSVFDLLGNELETVEYDMEGEIYSSKYYEYVTDPRGNWIRKLSYENDELFWIDEREISYY